MPVKLTLMSYKYRILVVVVVLLVVVHRDSKAIMESFITRRTWINPRTSNVGHLRTRSVRRKRNHLVIITGPVYVLPGLFETYLLLCG